MADDILELQRAFDDAELHGDAEQLGGLLADHVDARDEWSAPRVLTSMSSVPEQTQPGSDETAARVRGLDTSVAHPARVYDYLLGGKDNFAADREAAERLLSVVPFMRKQSRANRLFLGTAVHYLVRAGVRQFLDIGTGLPAANKHVSPDPRRKDHAAPVTPSSRHPEVSSELPICMGLDQPERLGPMAASERLPAHGAWLP